MKRAFLETVLRNVRSYSVFLFCVSFLLFGCTNAGTGVAGPVPAPVSPGIADGTEPLPQTALSPDDLPSIRKDIVFSFIGDVMLAAENGDDGFWSFNRFAYDTPKDYYFAAMHDFFANDDFTVANCENVFTDQVLPKKEKEEDPAFWYYSGTENAEIFSSGSVEIVSIANNHALDYGTAGRDDTIAAIEAAGCICARDGKGMILECGGLKIGLLCVSLYSEYWVQPILDWLEEVRLETDYRIVYYHGGTERTHTPDAWRVRASHRMAEAGADLILGNHPHVLQPKETYQGVEIVYSLGNFLFGGSHTCENRTIVYRLTLHAEDGVLCGTEQEIVPCYCYGELWQPAVIENAEVRQRVLDFMDGMRETPD